MYRSRTNAYRRPGRFAGIRVGRRWQVAGVVAVAVTVVGVGLGVASASESTVPTVVCPGVADALPSVPAQSQAEVERNLALLNTQIAEANNRLKTTVGQGGPNFIQNAILGPLKDKRVATIDRIAISIGRHAAKPVLDEQALGTCTLSATSSGATGSGAATSGTAGTPEPTVVATADPSSGNSTAAAPTVNCPELTGLPSIPAQAKAEVESNLTLLQNQINEANARLASTVGQGGPNFIQNAILGPLADKRTATINRIATAIGRNAARPDLNVEGTAPCTLNQ
jgi:hypothetical protein